MGPLGVVITIHEFSDKRLQMGCIQRNDVIQELPAQSTAEPLDKRVLVRATKSGLHFLNPAGLEKFLQPFPVDSVIIPEKILRPLSPHAIFPKPDKNGKFPT